MQSPHLPPLIPLRPPYFDPKATIGWELGPLDGLSCYLRCVEAILHAHGYGTNEVVASLLQPLDLLRKESNSSQFLGCEVRWFQDGKPHDQWETMRRLLHAGEPIIFMPDAYYWRGHEFEGHRHVHDHIILLSAEDSGEVVFFDTDAPSESKFQCRVPIDAQFISACSRFGRLIIFRNTDRLTPEQIAYQLLIPNLPRFLEDIISIEAFHAQWMLEPMPNAVLQALHVMMLGDFQSQLIIFALSLKNSEDPRYQRIASTAEKARKCAFQLGLELRIEHKVPGSTYLLSKAALASLSTALRLFLGTASEAMSVAPNIASQRVNKTDRFKQRMQDLAGWCFDGKSRSD